MSKIVPLKDFGIPVPSPAPDPSLHLIAYYGPQGFTPAYTPAVNGAGRVDAGPLSGLSQKTVNGVAYYDDPVGAQLPAGIASGAYDFYFTLMDSGGNEGDFNPPITAKVDTTVPPTLGQPVVLG